MTLVSDRLRKQLSKNTELGAGNFLTYARQVATDPGAPLLFLEKPFVTPDGPTNQLSLVDLERLSATYAAWYLQKGVVRQDLVSIYLDDSVDYLVHYLALTRLGAVAVLINGNMDPKIAIAHAKRVGSKGIVIDRSHLKILPSQSEISFEFAAVIEIDSPKNWQEHQATYVHSDGDPIMIAHSSGTTGIPKAVLLEHDKFFYGVRYRLGVPHVSGGERILSSLPHSHNCAIAYLMLALLSGTSVFISSDHGGANVLQCIRDFKPTMVVSFPQTFVELTEQNLDQYDLSSIRLWYNGGDAAHESHIRQLVAQGTYLTDTGPKKGSVFIDGMGSSEMGFSLFRNVHTPTTNRYDRCVGKPLSWVKAAVLAEDGTTLPPHQVGRLGVKAPSVTTGYWNDSPLTYKSRLRGYFLTGDLAYQDDEGHFFHVDRVPDVIVRGDVNVYTLQTEEFLMARFSEISDCSVVSEEGLTTQAIVYVRLKTKFQIPMTTLLERFNTALHDAGLPELDDARQVGSEAIPLGTTGKVLKRILREQHMTATV